MLEPGPALPEAWKAQNQGHSANQILAHHQCHGKRPVPTLKLDTGGGPCEMHQLLQPICTNILSSNSRCHSRLLQPLHTTELIEPRGMHSQKPEPPVVGQALRHATGHKSNTASGPDHAQSAANRHFAHANWGEGLHEAREHIASRPGRTQPAATHHFA